MINFTSDVIGVEHNIVACPRDCYDTCFFKLVKENERKYLEPIEVPFGVKSGCPRALKDFERAMHKSRVLYPHIAVKKCQRNFKKVPWDAAIKIVSEKLKQTLSEYGPEKVLLVDYAGNMGLLSRHYPQRLWYYLKISRTDYSLCDGSGDEAIKLHYGSTYGANIKEMYNSKLLVYWGFNPSLTSLHNFKIATELKKVKGVKIITIDVLKTLTSKISDLWLRPRPGTDTILALGVANYLIENGLIDKNFIRSQTIGFKEFSEHVKRFDLKHVSHETGVPVNKIVKFCEFYWEFKPSIIFIGYGLQRRMGGGEAARAISLLPALIGLHRGFYYSNTDGSLIDIGFLRGSHLGKPSRVIPQSMLGSYLEKGDFKFVYVFLTNPAASYPNAGAIKKGLCRDDVFVVVHDTHWGDTACLADVVLPAPTYLEKFDIVRGYWHDHIAYSIKVMDTMGESKSEIEVAKLIAKGLGLDTSKIFGNVNEVLKKTLGQEILEELREKGYSKLPYRSLSEYQTPSGKIEFYSSTAFKNGKNPLPMPVKEEKTEYPFNLITSSDVKYTNSQFTEVYGMPEPCVFINPVDAKELGVVSNDVVEVESIYDSVKLKVAISDVVPPKVVLALKQTISLDGKRINVLTRDMPSEHGGATINSTRVRIVK